MSSEQPGGSSNSGGDRGKDEGQDGRSSKEDKKSDGKTPNAATSRRSQRHSQQVNNVLRVIRSGVDRLTTERTQLETVMSDISLSEGILDEEIVRLERMRELSQQAMAFQHGNLSADDWQRMYAAAAPPPGPPVTGGEPTAGPSSATGSAGTSAITGDAGASAAISDAGTSAASDLRAMTDRYLFSLGSEDLGTSGNADLGAVGYFNELVEGMGLDMDIFPEDLLEEVMRNLREGHGDDNN